MIKRIVEISREPAHLALRYQQLLLERDHQAAATIPCEDLGVVLVDHPAVTYTHQALAAIVEQGAVLIVCGRDHLPAGVLLPLSSHDQIVWRIQEQIAVSKPVGKRLWQQIIVAKVRGQAANLRPGTLTQRRLLELAREVKSGDTTNVESQAARLYWGAWLEGHHPLGREAWVDPLGLAEAAPIGGAGGERGDVVKWRSGDGGEARPEAGALAAPSDGTDAADPQLETRNLPGAKLETPPPMDLRGMQAFRPFRRDADSLDPLNAMLNYGYAVVRAAVARALVGAGLFPALGLHHRHRGNPFCLADDVMEPLRPLVDAKVRDLYRAGRGLEHGLDQPVKAALLEVLHETVRVGEQSGPLMVGLHRTAASLVRCYQGAEQTLLLPERVGSPLPSEGEGRG